MTPIATAPALEAARVVAFEARTTQLEKTAITDAAPWLYSAFWQIRDLERTGRNLPGVGDLRISADVASRARLLLSLICMSELPVPVVSPVSGGGISITWMMGEREVKFSFYPDGESLLFQVDNDEVTHDAAIDLTNPAAVTAPIQWMVQG